MKNKHLKLCLQMEMSHSKHYINPCPFFPHKSQFCLETNYFFIMPVGVLLLFCRYVMFDSLQPHGLKHARLPLSFNVFRSLLKLMSIESVMPSNHLILCHPCLLLLSIFPSTRVSLNESALHMDVSNHSFIQIRLK